MRGRSSHWFLPVRFELAISIDLQFQRAFNLSVDSDVLPQLLQPVFQIHSLVGRDQIIIKYGYETPEEAFADIPVVAKEEEIPVDVLMSPLPTESPPLTVVSPSPPCQMMSRRGSAVARGAGDANFKKLNLGE